MNKVSGLFRATFFILAVLVASGCATTYEAATIDQSLKTVEYEELNRTGNHKALIKYNGQMSGDALVLGIYGSSHTYKYDFSPYLEESIEQVVNKVYQSVEVRVVDSQEVPAGVGIIRIEFEPPNVRLNCFAVSQIKGSCASVTRMNVTVTTPVGEVQKIQIEEERSTEPGLSYQGAPNAISASVGASVNNFSEQLYTILSSYQNDIVF